MKNVKMGITLLLLTLVLVVHTHSPLVGKLKRSESPARREIYEKITEEKFILCHFANLDGMRTKYAQNELLQFARKCVYF